MAAPPPRRAKRWIVWVASAALCAFAVFLVVKDQQMSPLSSLPVEPSGAEEAVELPRHDPTLDADGRAEAVAVGDFDVAVLETNRHATEDWTDAQMDVGFPAALVMTTVYVKYNGEGPVEFTEALAWDFGSTEGTNNGYNPWDDWCPGWDNSVLNVSVMLPGEAQVLRVCVPVALEDATGLDMHVSANPADFSGPYRTFGLPPDGTVYSAPLDASKNDPYTVAKAEAKAEGVWRADTYTPTRTWVVQTNDDETVRIAAEFSVRRSATKSEGTAWNPEVRGPSGASYLGGPCPGDDVPSSSDDTASTIHECWDVSESDAHDLVAVFADVWWTGDLLVLRLPEPTTPR